MSSNHGNVCGSISSIPFRPALRKECFCFKYLILHKCLHNNIQNPWEIVEYTGSYSDKLKPSKVLAPKGVATLPLPLILPTPCQFIESFRLNCKVQVGHQPCAFLMLSLNSVRISAASIVISFDNQLVLFPRPYWAQTHKKPLLTEFWGVCTNHLGDS